MADQPDQVPPYSSPVPEVYPPEQQAFQQPLLAGVADGPPLATQVRCSRSKSAHQVCIIPMMITVKLVGS